MNLNRVEDDLRLIYRAYRPPTHELLEGILHPNDVEAEWLGDDYYPWYAVVAAYFRPRSILEIGVRYGYSLAAMITGSGLVSVARGFDAELDQPGSSSWAAQRLGPRFPDTRFFLTNINTQQQVVPHFPRVDLAHVDADHTKNGTIHDCTVAWTHLRKGGVLLVDDVGPRGDPHTRAGADQFCGARGLQPIMLPTYRGLYVIRRPR